jgi:hypothetical protein
MRLEIPWRKMGFDELKIDGVELVFILLFFDHLIEFGGLVCSAPSRLYPFPNLSSSHVLEFFVPIVLFLLFELPIHDIEPSNFALIFPFCR